MICIISWPMIIIVLLVVIIAKQREASEKDKPDWTQDLPKQKGKYCVVHLYPLEGQQEDSVCKGVFCEADRKWMLIKGKGGEMRLIRLAAVKYIIWHE